VNTIFLRVLEAQDKATALLKAVSDPERARGREWFMVQTEVFATVAGSPFAYWTPESVRRAFVNFRPFEGEGRTVKHGAATLDDFRYVRVWWEYHPTTLRDAWIPFVKGGRRSHFYGDISSAIGWRNGGREVKSFVEAKVGSASRTIQATSFYFRPGITWPLRGTRFSAQAVPAECIFSVAGKMAFADDRSDLLWCLGILNSSIADSFIITFAGKVGGVQYESGLIAKVPMPPRRADSREVISKLVRRGWSLKRSLNTCTETSHAFTAPALLQVAGNDAAIRASVWSEHVRGVEAELVDIQTELDDQCLALYRIDEADRRSIAEGFSGDKTNTKSSAYADDSADNADEEAAESEPIADTRGLATELISWAVGAAFGRFDVRVATGARLLPTEPEPFEPLPACSPGMLTGDDGLPLVRTPTGYPLLFPENGVLTDDPGHSNDLTATVRAVFDVAFGVDADRWWNDIAAVLNPKDQELRSWLVGRVFEHHLKRYSRSRRKAPIYWQLSTPSVRYSVWLYAHRLTRDTFFQLQNDVVGPKLLHEEQQLAILMRTAGGSPSSSERREITEREGFVDELRAMGAEVKRIAPLWNPNLDDGVVINFAPLWRLTPQHKAWQKELKATWEALCDGAHEWTQLAMHLWPERVIPKCATDRSLAIAHGLEEVFWMEERDGRWKKRPTPTRPVDELVRERTSAAVKSALRALIEAPTPNGSKAKPRRSSL
jgi:hypothetical protein